jgi:CRISPR/Cas system-associated exonuclease Cas4 (RecB family)
MPGIFGTIDKLMKEFYAGKHTAEIAPELPPGMVRFSEKWVESVPFEGLKRKLPLYFRGKFDTLIAFDDGSYGIVDFKTSVPKSHHILFYGRQLHAYAYALEHAAQGKFNLQPISKLGLLVFSPIELSLAPENKIAYAGNVVWMEIERRDEAFVDFMEQVAALLERPNPPEAEENCSFCRYRVNARGHGL